MKNKHLSTNLSKHAATNLSKFDEAIAEFKERIKTLKRSIRTLEELRDSGMSFPGEKDTAGLTENAKNVRR